MEQSTGRVPMDAKVTHEPWRDRNSRYVAEAGPVRAYGKTKTQALQRLSVLILEALTHMDAEPAFARDAESGEFLAAVPTPYGVTHWKVDERGYRSITFTDGPAAESLRGYGFEIVQRA